MGTKDVLSLTPHVQDNAIACRSVSQLILVVIKLFLRDCLKHTNTVIIKLRPLSVKCLHSACGCVLVILQKRIKMNTFKLRISCGAFLHILCFGTYTCNHVYIDASFEKKIREYEKVQ